MYPPKIQAIIDYPKENIPPRLAAPVMEVNPYWINLVAKEHPERLPFAVYMSGCHVKIPKWPFLAAYGYTREV